MQDYNIVVGLEIHAEIDTKSKAFCTCRNEFGALPNTQVCPVCLGLPGALPVLNKKAVEYTIMGGLSFGCDISNRAIFERKNYVYPDLPKSYQITQLTSPLCTGGGIRLDSGKFVRFNRIHLEEDCGKLIHTENETLVDFNRSGVPLIEMVTEPDLHSSADVVEFLNKLKTTLLYSGVSKCRMEEGELRFDLNLSVNPSNSDNLGTRVEIKNLTSFKSVEKAIEYESQRQISEIEKGNILSLETRCWDEDCNETYLLRKKETELDYRYFPDPDIMPVEIGEKDIQRLKSRLPELIDSRRSRLLSMGLKDAEVSILINNKELMDYYLEVVTLTNEPIESLNWIMTELLHETKNIIGITLKDIISVENMAFVINAVVSQEITRANGKVLFDQIIKTGKDASVLIKELDLIGDVNKKDIVDLVGMLINSNPEIIDDYDNYPDEVLNFFIGNILKHTQNKAKVDYIKPLVIEIIKSKK